ncbi:hypothetical protein ACINB_35820 [Acidovorax sp. NB1]|nr:hypothetical protein ACINB_35820 [Acidovorax sp. NB1]
MPVAAGDRFGNLTVLRFADGVPKMAQKATFRCDCGTEKAIRLAHVISGVTVSCGCVKQKHQAPKGSKFGRLTVIDDTPNRDSGNRKVLCRCSCGVEKLVGVWELANGVTNSCGCIVIENARAMSLTHGEEGTPLYVVWHSMKARCQIPSAGPYERYGGRGISVCQEWSDSYVKFRDWALAAGYKQGLQIDRRDNDGDYEPGNCRWVTPVVNANNRGNHRTLTAFGETKTMAEWARDDRCAVSISALKQRVRKGRYTDEEAITLAKGRHVESVRREPE